MRVVIDVPEEASDSVLAHLAAVRAGLPDGVRTTHPPTLSEVWLTAQLIMVSAADRRLDHSAQTQLIRLVGIMVYWVKRGLPTDSPVLREALRGSVTRRRDRPQLRASDFVTIVSHVDEFLEALIKMRPQVVDEFTADLRPLLVGLAEDLQARYPAA
jgi:hypothetical protein